MTALFPLPSIDAAAQETAERISITDECIAIACVKALTDRIERTGHGLWMSDPGASTVRAIVYNAAGIEGWSHRHDKVARKRLVIWTQLFWLPRQEEREVE